MQDVMFDGDRLDEIVDLMPEIVCTRRKTIRNIKQYLRAVIFNVPSTIGNYCTSLVAHDMASGALAPKELNITGYGIPLTPISFFEYHKQDRFRDSGMI